MFVKRNNAFFSKIWFRCILPVGFSPFVKPKPKHRHVAQDTLTLIMELLEGGELFDRIISLGGWRVVKGWISVGVLGVNQRPTTNNININDQQQQQQQQQRQGKRQQQEQQLRTKWKGEHRQLAEQNGDQLYFWGRWWISYPSNFMFISIYSKRMKVSGRQFWTILFVPFSDKTNCHQLMRPCHWWRGMA